MGKGIVTSDQHVDVKLTNGTLSSDRLRITGGGEVIRFEGHVVMHLDNTNIGGGAPDASASASASPAVQETPPAPAHPAKARPGKSANSK
jgi:lipopolysaccharide export system protein LptC